MIFVLRFHLGKMTFIISVNGNIACGKSTLLRALEKRGYVVVMEGLDRYQWGNVLSMYYKNPRRYGYLFQTLVAAEMKETYAALRAGKYEKFTEKDDPKVIFTERSHVDCLAFAKLVWRQNNMSNVEYQTFKRIYNIMLEQPDLIISLELAPEICFERCKARARKCENELQLSYLQEVDKTMKEVMSDNQPVENAPKQIKINVLGKTTRSIVEEVEKIIGKASPRAGADLG